MSHPKFGESRLRLACANRIGVQGTHVVSLGFPGWLSDFVTGNCKHFN